MSTGTDRAAVAHTIADRVSLRIADVARVTGLSKSLVRGLIRDGELPAVKVRTVPLVLVADLLGFLERCRTNPRGDIERISAEIVERLGQKGG
jgi:excisionase family DNA binding protein